MQINIKTTPREDMKSDREYTGEKGIIINLKLNKMPKIFHYQVIRKE